jgi:hypothetical protein
MVQKCCVCNSENLDTIDKYENLNYLSNTATKKIVKDRFISYNRFFNIKRNFNISNKIDKK